MATTTDIKAWVDFIEFEDYNEVYCVYQLVKNLGEWGGFKCTKKNTSEGNMYFVEYGLCANILMLSSDKARDYFLNYIKKMYGGDGMDIETWYSLKREMEKED